MRVLPRVAGLLAVLAVASSPAVAQPAYTAWYLAEGNTAFFEEDILIANPNTQAADIEVTYLRPNEQPPIVKTFTLGATRRTTIRVDGTLDSRLAATDVSAVVRCTNGLDIAVERSMYQTGSGGRFGHNATAVAGAATTWYLAEGSTGMFDDFVLVANPDTTSKAAVRVSFLRDSGSPIVSSYELQPGERRTIWVNIDFAAQLGSTAFSTLVESVTSATVPTAIPVFVERAMYFPSKLQTNPPVWKGGHGTAAVTSPALTWLFAEGFTGNSSPNTTFDTFLLLGNASTTAAAQATVTFFTDTQQTFSKVYAVPPNRRVSIWVDLFTCDAGGGATPVPNQCNSGPGVTPLSNAAFSTSVTSTAPIVAERAMYWGPGPPSAWKEAHDAVGLTADAKAFAFAEGAEGAVDPSGDLYTTFYLISNPANTPLQLEVTFYRQDGTGIVRTTTVPPRSRGNIWSASYPELSNQRFAAVVESTNNVEFVAERAMYWGANFDGGHASPGTPWVNAAGGIKPVGTPPLPPNPTVMRIVPASGPVTGGTAVTITGTEFTAGSTVRIGGAAASNVVVVNSTTITAVTPPGTVGGATVEVTSRGVSASFPTAFTYTPPPFSVAGLFPSSGPTTGGTMVTVTGTGFAAGAMVTFGGIAATSVVVDSAMQIRATTPPHGDGAVTVQVQVGTDSASLASAFTFVPATATDMILAYGDSITKGTTTFFDASGALVVDPDGDGGYPVRLDALLSARYPNQPITVRNAGVAGECVATDCGTGGTGASRFPGTLLASDDLVIVMEGTNDVNAGLSVSTIINSLRTIVVAAQHAGKEVILSSLNPHGDPAINAFLVVLNADIRDLAIERDVVFVDVFNGFPSNGLGADGLHPNAAGYGFIARRYYDAIVQYFETIPPVVP